MNELINRRVLLEVCIDDAAGIAAAAAGGADRIEVCSALSVGGLTPSAGLMRAARTSGIPAVAMIRPRAGNFIFSKDDLAAMLADIALAREIGMTGVVIGAARPDHTLDLDMLARLRDAAGPLEVCLHRVFDLTPDPFAAIDQAVELGFSRILTSGQAQSVPEGLALLRELSGYAAGRISILPGGGITRANVGDVVRALGTREIHASCGRPQAADADLLRFGFSPPGGSKPGDPELIGEMRRMLALIAAPDAETGIAGRQDRTTETLK